MKDSYRKLIDSGQLTQRQLEVYEVMLRARHQFPDGMTAREVASFLTNPDFAGRPHSGVHGRLRELEYIGLVYRLPNRRHCSTTNRMVTVWAYKGA